MIKGCLFRDGVNEATQQAWRFIIDFYVLDVFLLPEQVWVGPDSLQIKAEHLVG